MLLLKHLVRHHFPLQAPLDLITTAAGTSPAFMSSLGNPATAIGSSPPVIVVGAGLAGLAAASQLSGAHGVPVLLLEAAAKIGGNSIKASSGINGTPTRWQAAAFAKERAQRRERLQKEGEQAGKQSDAEAEGDKPDSVALFTNDTIVSAGHAYVHSTGVERTRRNRLIAALTSNSASAVDWLADAKGVDLSTVARSGGHARARTHRGAAGPPPGFAIVSALRRELEASPLVTVRLGARVTRVLREADEVVGVQYSVAGGGSSSGGGGADDGGKDTSSTSAATAYGPVIFATGGFAGDAHGQLARHRPDLAGYPTTSDQRPGTGPLLVAAGARETDMALVQVHPTGFVDPARPRAVSKILAAEALRGEGGMLLVGRGRRFVDELRRRDEVTAAEYANADELRMGEQEQEQKEKGQEQESATRQWDVTLLIDEGVAAAMSTHLGFYTAKRLLRRTTVGALTAGTTTTTSSSSSMPDLPATLRAYAAAATGTAPDPFGRTAFGHWALSEPHPDAVVYVGAVTPVVHFTMGGVEVDEWGRVLDGWSKRRPATEGDGAAGEDGDLAPIAGLWAAGEVTGGLHGANRLGGSSLLECVVFGRRVADAAAAFWRGHYHRD